MRSSSLLVRSKFLRNCRYALWCSGRFLAGLPFSIGMFLDAAAPNMFPSQKRNGMRILDPIETSRIVFADAMNSALDLIEQNDKMRFARVTQEIHLLLNMPLFTYAQYSRPFKVCTIDLRGFPIAQDKEMAVVFLASVIIHEATHGVLHRRRILHSGRNFDRVEKLCLNEERRFGKRLGLDLGPWISQRENPRRPFLRERLAHALEEIKNLWSS